MNILLLWIWIYIFYWPMVLVIFTSCLHIADVQSSVVMSVDLGSEWMKVSTVSPGKPAEIVLNERSKKMTPSAITFHKGVRAFGEEALAVGVYSPSNCYIYFLDLLGKKIENPVVDIFKERFPYYNIISDAKRNTVLFKNNELNEQFSPEELVAMMLEKARDLAQKHSGQVINEAVLSVPGFFGQAERYAILNAAQLAGLKVLQLINSYTAVALNYGTSLTREFNEFPIHMMFYDMGAYSTQVSVVSYQLVKSDKVASELQPQLTVLGVGYERNLGGLEIQIRLRDYLATKFNNLNLSSNDVTKNHISMAKLFKEAGRLKKILSVNTDCFADIKGLIDSKDMHIKVTRKELEDICKDLFAKAVLPAKRALEASGLTIELIKQVILVGAGSRFPVVQDCLIKDLKISEPLNWSLNTNEAVVLGAAYKAADISNEFEVESFIIKEANIFPMEVIFCEGVIDEIKPDEQMKQVFLDYMSSYPLRKTLTFTIFNKYQQNFNLTVNYAKLNNLDEKEINCLGSLSLSIIKLKWEQDIHSKLQSEEDLVDKQIEVYFSMNSSGILVLENVELSTENTVMADKKEKFILSSENSVKRGQKEESILSTIINTINTLYKGLKKFVIDKLFIYNILPSSLIPVTTNSKNTKKVTIKEPMDINHENLFVLPVEGDDLQSLIVKMKKLKEKDIAQLHKEKSLDNLLTIVVETREKLNQPEYANAATDVEIQSILDICTEITNWLGYDGLDGETEEFDFYSNKLKIAIKPVWDRTLEHLERPTRLKELDSTLNSSKLLLDEIEKVPLKDTPFTLVEINTLEKSIAEITSWRDEKVKEQEKLPKYVTPILTIQEIVMKDENIKHEMNNVMYKFKSWKSKNKDKEIVKDLDLQDEWPRKSREAENIVIYTNAVEPTISRDHSEKIDVTYWIRDRLDGDSYIGLILLFLSILVIICLFSFVCIRFK